jgi:hypothetical protein
MKRAAVTRIMNDLRNGYPACRKSGCSQERTLDGTFHAVGKLPTVALDEASDLPLGLPPVRIGSGIEDATEKTAPTRSASRNA